MPLTQAEAELHGDPVGVPQVPPEPQVPPTHCPPLVQGWPTGRSGTQAPEAQ
jgi:hypothetical protein